MSTDIKVLNIFLDDLNETLFSRLDRAVAHTKSQWLWQHTQKLGMIKADHPSMEDRAAGEMLARKPLMTSWGEGGMSPFSAGMQDIGGYPCSRRRSQPHAHTDSIKET